MTDRSGLAVPSAGLEMFEFLLVFDLATGSPKVNYFMVDPAVPSRLFPKMNTINFNKVRNNGLSAGLQFDWFLFVCVFVFC